MTEAKMKMLPVEGMEVTWIDLSAGRFVSKHGTEGLRIQSVKDLGEDAEFGRGRWIVNLTKHGQPLMHTWDHMTRGPYLGVVPEGSQFSWYHLEPLDEPVG